MPRQRDDSQGLSIRAYAEHRKESGLKGSSPGAVQKALASGRIGVNASGRIDPRTADAAWAKTTRAKAPEGEMERTPVGAGGAQVNGEPETDTYARARAHRESFAARLLELEFKKKSESLVSTDDVKMEAFKQARSLRDRLLNIAGNLGPVLAGITDPPEIEQRLAEAIRQALEGAADASAI